MAIDNVCFLCFFSARSFRSTLDTLGSLGFLGTLGVQKIYFAVLAEKACLFAQNVVNYQVIP